MRVSERLLLVLAMIMTAVSALFCIIALATKIWRKGPTSNYTGLFCSLDSACPKSSAALSILSFILLIASIVSLVLLLCGILHRHLRFIPLILLFIASIFLLATFAAYFQAFQSHSYNLMVVAHFCCYVALIILAFWLGGLFTLPDPVERS